METIIKNYEEYHKVKQLLKDEAEMGAALLSLERSKFKLNTQLNLIGEQIDILFKELKAKAGLLGAERVSIDFEKGTLLEVKEDIKDA